MKSTKTTKAPSIKIADSQGSAASLTGIPVTRIRAAKRAGCDAFFNGRVDLAKLRAWMKANPRGKARQRSSSMGTAADAPGQSGAGPALARLESAELRAWHDLQDAFREGFEEDVRDARRAWLAVSDALRKHDLALEESRRTSGQLMPRAECERILAQTGRLLRIALRSARHVLAPALAGQTDVVEIARTLQGMSAEAAFQMFAGLNARGDAAGNGVPAWAFAALSGPFEEGYPDGVFAEKLAGLARSMGILMELTLAQIKEMEAPSGSPS